MKNLVSVLALASCLGIAAASAQDAAAPERSALDKDVSCLAIYMVMGGSDKPEFQQAGLLGSFYWFGRLEGQAPGVDMQERIGATIDTLKAEKFQLEAERCGAEMMARGKAISDIGQRMMDREAPPAKPDEQKAPDGAKKPD